MYVGGVRRTLGNVALRVNPELSCLGGEVWAPVSGRLTPCFWSEAAPELAPHLPESAWVTRAGLGTFAARRDNPGGGGGGVGSAESRDAPVQALRVGSKSSHSEKSLDPRSPPNGGLRSRPMLLSFQSVACFCASVGSQVSPGGRWGAGSQVQPLPPAGLDNFSG